MYQNNHDANRQRTRSGSKGWVAVVVLVILVAVLAGSFFLIQRRNQGDNKAAATPTNQTPTFDKTQFSLTDPASPWLVVNKQRPLEPRRYKPSDLRLPDMDIESSAMEVNGETATALEALNAAAKNEGIHFIVASAYRSYDNQATTYQSVVNGYGQAEADRQSARPGYSEHQTGWAADLGALNGECRIELCFGDTPEGKWLAANAYKFGFIIRYPDGKENITGYLYEPWHVRYVGRVLSEEMHRTNIQTLEEFFGVPAAPTY